MMYHLLSFLDLCILQEPAGSYSYIATLVSRTLVFFVFLYFCSLGECGMDWDGFCFIAPPTVMGLVFFYFLFRSVLKDEEEEENLK